MTTEERLEALQEYMDSLSNEEFYTTFYGYSKIDYEKYVEETFVKDISIVTELLKESSSVEFSDLYEELSNQKMFYRCVTETFDFFGKHDWEYIYESPMYNLQLVVENGQGTISTFSLLYEESNETSN